jgi:hypothetical protein
VVEIRRLVTHGEPLTMAEAVNEARRVLHWYDFLCPFCYVGQQRNSIFEEHGFG